MDTSILKFIDMCLSNNPATIKTGQDEIYSLLNTNYISTLYCLTQVISNETLHKNIRKMAIVFIKNHFSLFREVWNAQQESIRDEIKISLLSSLGISEFDILKLVSSCISEIAKVEFSFNRWKELIDTLLNALENEELKHQYASLLTLQFILQDIPIKSLSITEVQFCFSKIFIGVNKIHSMNEFDNKNLLVVQYLNTIFELIKFCKTLISEPQLQSLVLNQIFALFNYSFDEYLIISIKILTEVFEHFYYLIDKDNCFDKLYKITKTLFHSSNAQIIEMICELWNTIANYETKNTTQDEHSIFYSKRNKKLCCSSYELISDCIINTLLISDKSTFNSDEWNYIKSTFSLIMSFSTCCPAEFIKKIYNFTVTNYQDSNVIIKERAILAYASLLESKISQSYLEVTVENTINEFLQLIGDSQLRKSIGFTIERTFKYFSKYLCSKKKSSEIGSIHQNLIKLVFDYVNKDIKFTLNMINSSIYLFNEIKNEIQIDFNILDSILSLALSPAQFDFNFTVSEHLFYLIGFAVDKLNECNYTALNNFFLRFIERFVSISEFLNSNNINTEDATNYEFAFKCEASLCEVLSHFINNRYLILGEAELNQVISLLVKSAEHQKRVFEYFFLVLCSIAESYHEFTSKYIPNFMIYIMAGLECFNDYNICYTTFQCIDKFTNIFTEEHSSYIKQIIEKSISLISENLTTSCRNLRSDILEIVGVLYNSFPSIAHSYFNQIMVNIKFAITAALASPEEVEDEEDEMEVIDYQLKLSLSVVICLNMILKQLESYGQQNILLPDLELILSFLNNMGKRDDLKDDLVLSILGFYSDLLVNFRDKIYVFYDQNVFNKLLTKAFMVSDGLQIANYARKVLDSLR